MTGERVYSVTGATAEPARPITLAEAGLRERSDLQEWVIARPEILGPGVMVVAFEFGHWQSARGERQLDRLDVLGLDTDGRLVVAELKRDRAPDTVEMQAIKYAAMSSRFTEEDLVAHYARFHTRQTGAPVTEEAARDALLEHAGELDTELLRQPRIVLVAGSFSPVTTASVVWLNEMGLDITLQQVQAYRVGDQIVVTVSQTYPVPDVEEFTVAPQRAEARAARSRRSRFDRDLLHEIVAALPAGRWTTYGDVAPLVGTWPQPLGRHITSCRLCVNAQRILNSDGLPNPGFTWSDPSRTDTQREALEAEGVTFVGEHADPASRLSPDELAALLD